MPSPRTIRGILRVWTDAMDDILRKCVAENKSYAVAAKEIKEELKVDVTRNSVIGRAHRLGLKNPLPKHSGPRIPIAKRVRKVSPRPRRQPVKQTVVKTSFEALLECVEVVPLNIGLMDLEPKHCRYPYGDGPFLFCGHPKESDSSYCPAHTKLCAGVGTYAERAAAPMPNKASTRKSSIWGTYEAA